MRFISVFLALSCALIVPGDAFGESRAVVYALDFSKQPDGDAVSWLKRQGFEFQLNAHELSPRFQRGRLVLETTREVAGLFVQRNNPQTNQRATHLRVVWGVDRYPQGADWARGVNRLPIAVMVWFGDEEIDSGMMFLPSAPYFLSVFLGEREEEGRAYLGKYYRRSGRYFCQPCGARPGQTLTTELPLERHFTEQFRQTLPPVSGLGFQMNTTDTSGGARAFLVRIELLR